MKSGQWLRGLLAVLVVLAISVPASAAVTLLDKEGMTVTTDAFFNTFYVYSSSDNEISGVDRDQSRVKMGFLPNYIGFNFSKQVNDKLKIGGRSSFWVTINDSEENVTETGIDVRQFYGTVDGDWGQVLFGKDFGLFCRSNIFLDEILQGYGNVSDTLGLIDGTGVSFGNIGTGYIYPFPNAQITYRSPVLAGFRLAVGIVDPAHTADNFETAVVPEESAPQFQGELTYMYNFDNGGITAWVGFLQQTSEDASDNTDVEVDSEGISYGIQAKYAWLTLHASGFDASGVGLLLGPGVDNTLGLPLVEANGDEIDSNGYLLQAAATFGPHRLVGSYGKNKLEPDDSDEWENETATGAYFYTFNDYLKVVAEYNQNKISIGSDEETTDTIALGGIISF
jgi:predicted porin